MVGISLVIPCYNEGANLSLLVERCRRVVAHEGVEVILVDNGSRDDTPAILQRLLTGETRIRSVRVELNQGYGFGILSGLRVAEHPILAWTHADMQTDPLDLLKGLRLYRSLPEPERLFVKGRRHGRPLADLLFTVGMGVFESMLLRVPLWDINAQPTMLPKCFFEKWQNPPHDFSLDLYAYYHAKHQGLRVERFPVLFGKRAHGVSHWNINWRAKYKFIKRTVDFSLSLRRRLKG
ncbi:MAG: glycosyltransferase family 2 protein [Magnetococcales bacterium]|nr:glycosyltransferase family 2 protein [Magnetococcales bacterium]MBF0321429.1 glycosyltransferase family 2 protein [Magnetococcales bacterium]